MKNWTNLHNHTVFSMLDGHGSVEQYLERAKSLGMTGLATTDHGNIHSWLDFYDAGKSAGVKPILGSEFYQARKTRFDRDEEGRSLAHLAAAAGDQGMFVLYALKKVNAAMLLAKDAAGLTPLHYACAVGAKGVAAWLFSQPGGEISSVTKDILQRIPLDLVPTESGENDWKFLL